MSSSKTFLRPPLAPRRGGRGRPPDSRRDGGATELIFSPLRIFLC
jgi:hypothetical protein